MAVSQPQKPQKSLKVKKQSAKKVQTPMVEVYNLDGQLLETRAVAPQIFGARLNPTLEALAVRVYLANQRLGTVSTKTRGEVRGSTRKLYRQKHTGRSRQGSIRAPHRKGGGVVFGPVPRDFSLTLPKKAKRAALFSALTGKLQAGKVIALADLDKIEPKTKAAVKLFSKLPVAGKKLLVVDDLPVNLVRAVANLPDTSWLSVGTLNTYSVLGSDSVIFSVQALKSLEEKYLQAKGVEHEG